LKGEGRREGDGSYMRGESLSLANEDRVFCYIGRGGEKGRRKETSQGKRGGGKLSPPGLRELPSNCDSAQKKSPGKRGGRKGEQITCKRKKDCAFLGNANNPSNILEGAQKETLTKLQRGRGGVTTIAAKNGGSFLFFPEGRPLSPVASRMEPNKRKGGILVNSWKRKDLATHEKSFSLFGSGACPPLP